MSRLSRPTFSEERRLLAEGFALVAGVDEAGCGAWAGPVYAGAVILPKNRTVVGLRDSKTLSSAQRERLARDIKKIAVAWSIGVVSHEEVDALNVRRASNVAMRRAVMGLSPLPDYILSDAFLVKDVAIPCLNLVRGDGRVRSIAAASILAKVERDAFMKTMDAHYPEYGFAKHKGYGTRLHQAALQSHGLSPIHRLSYQPIQHILATYVP
jgi:ribonuclease HII